MDGQRAVVTGAGTEPGTSIARELAAAGATLVIGGPETDDLERVAADIPNTAETVRADVRDEFDVERLMHTAARGGHSIDVVVPAASVRHGPEGETPLDDESYAAFDDHLRTNLRGSFATIQEAVPHLSADARVIVPVEAEVRDVSPGGGSYAVSQAAVLALVRGFAADRPHPVTAVATRHAAANEIGETVRWAASEADGAEIDGLLLDPTDRPRA